VDDQITSKELKKNGGATKSNKRIEILHQEKDMQKEKKKKKEILSAKQICFCTRDSIKETTYKKEKKKKER
jgi:hypothetical protein